MIDSKEGDPHWDIRPSPRFGTVEVRVMDTPLTSRRRSPSLIHPDPRLLAADGEVAFKHNPDDYLLYPFNRYRACRCWSEGITTDVHSGEQRQLLRRRFYS